MTETRVKEHMEVIGADGVHVGTVDRVERGETAQRGLTRLPHRVVASPLLPKPPA